jgi:hypothetical protein
VPGIIKDVELLKELFELFAGVLEGLCSIGAASNTEPDVNI